ncbi:hypothetical protein RJ640_003907 [Escallonia rubra]|uniref:Exostosin GT47 domain-containing protein n=1 Tax=Escallonia rubra TaxID=112253 RepID=A0AA88UDH0_9ASTE|nr:hypothetical protein RJ640_003907 [Escallonia rubra]
MKKEVQMWVNTCHVCRQVKGESHAEEAKLLDTSQVLHDLQRREAEYVLGDRLEQGRDVPLKQHYLGTSYENMTVIVHNYVESLISKYPYWNRTLGADHFFVTCHDVGVRATEGVPLLVKNSIRAVCSPSYDVGFIPHKDVALPQVLQPFALPAGGNDVENRNSEGKGRKGKERKRRKRTEEVFPSDPPKNYGEIVVQKHFQWNSPPIRYDAFHMVMYDLWLRRHVIKY